ncbi:hypothetical protein SETIT_9G027500v2 [Setaria italica]|uniref:Uncharacterized protein n=1 Tax=Setaria italica TaxID=4555 RepID=K4AIF7_SETIT|nr:hypothetical protein SETIT_9G027500v2 [Setaria italica]
MGSLMSGWSSSVLSDKEVRMMRNRSLTMEDVEAFWRQHGGRPPAENGEAAAGGSPLAGSPRVGGHATISPLPSPRAEIPPAARQLKVMRSMPPLRGVRSDDLCSPFGGGHQAQHLFPRSEPSSPATTTRGRGEAGLFLPENTDAAAADTSSTTRGWWTRSSWAFLNDPPKEEVLLGRAQISFACDQFHAARIVTGNA